MTRGGETFPLDDDSKILGINFPKKKRGRTVCRCFQGIGRAMGYRGYGLGRRAVPWDSLVLGK